MITLGNGSALPIEGGLVRGVNRAGGSASTPGVELKAKFTRPEHPLAYGYPVETAAFRTDLNVYSVRPADSRFVVLQWGLRPTKDEREFAEGSEKADAKDGDKPDDKAGKSSDSSMVVSGGGKRLDDLEGHPAILDLPAGKGRVIAFNFSPMHRDLNHSDYRFLWNGILNWSALPPQQP
jgi:hypothetical protein